MYASLGLDPSPCPAEAPEPHVGVAVSTAAGAVYGTVTMTEEPVSPHVSQKETVVVQVSVHTFVTGTTAVSVVAAVVVVGFGRVRVTVVGVAAQWVQTVTVVCQPSGTVAVVLTAPDGGLVAVAVAAAAVSGQ